jgi:hypothetical protein
MYGVLVQGCIYQYVYCRETCSGKGAQVEYIHKAVQQECPKREKWCNRNAQIERSGAAVMPTLREMVQEWLPRREKW